ncbi:MAG: RNA polymerase sigma factor [Clostridia bacterium]|nr:RNA polymerase sigma factor [Clostridia bacterium]
MIIKNRPPDMEAIYHEYFPVIYNYVFYRLLNRENTEDIVSQVFVKVCRHLDTFDPERASLKTWIYRITDHLLIDFYRRQRPVLSIDHEESGLANELHVHFDEQYERIASPTRKAIFAALAQLSERERMFVYYKYFLNITNREIARQLNMNENTVSAVMARARKKLQGILAGEV